MTRDLPRLLRPRSIAVIGGGFWGANVIDQCRKMGFEGPIRPVHPEKDEVGGLPAVADISDLPEPPDAVFIGVNRQATIEVVARLREAGAGGAVCFASGFSEARAEMADGVDLQARLLAAAGEMPILGPNCYGFINYLDGVLLWPDQHGGMRCDSGVALVTQSSNIAINLTMQARGLPLAYVVTAGNQAQTGLAAIGEALLTDPRVTALGLHIEGIGDLRAFEALAGVAARGGKPVVTLKAGKSALAQAAAVSHTASLAGSDTGARALLARLGIAQVESLPALLETLKLMHFAGPLSSARIVSMSCSGGEASLMADAAVGRRVAFPPLDASQCADLRATLGPLVALSNPLDYHTYIWGDVPRMTETFTTMLRGDIALGCLVVDYPRPDRCDGAAWECTIAAAAAASRAARRPLAILSTLPEGLPEPTLRRIAEAGLIPLQGLDDAMTAIEAAVLVGAARTTAAPVLLPGGPRGAARLLGEAESKLALAAHGLCVPGTTRVEGKVALARAVRRMGLPLVLKGEGFAHKTEVGAVAVNLSTEAEVIEAAARMSATAWLVEEMVTGGVAELLLGVLRDPAHGFVLTLAAGGTLTEILRDSASLILPVTAQDIRTALDGLRIAPVLKGYRGQEGADIEAIVGAVLAVQDYVAAHAGQLEELEINPLICTPTGAVAVDALIRTGEDE